MKYYILFLTFLGCALSSFAEEKTCEPKKNVMLEQTMRKLWSDHVIWTRQYIVGTVARYKDTPAAAERLLKNQDDIGSAIASYYGKEAGATLARLLKEHIMIATEVVNAALENSSDNLKKADKKWHDNADDIADFLSKANPNWSKLDLKSMLYRHLDLTTKEVKLRIGKNWKEDVVNFDNVYDQALKMADTLSEGIVKQFLSK
jgi:hypothetical protein